MIKSLFDAVKLYPPLDTEEEVELFDTINNSDDEQEVQEAKDKVVRHHIWLACYIVEHYFSKQASMSVADREDLIQTGIQSIIEKAVDRFEPSKGYKFSTYARWWVFDGVNRLLQKMSDIRVPQQLIKIQKKIRELKEDAEVDITELSKDEVAMRIGEKPKDIRRAAKVPDVEYLGQEKYEDGERALVDFIKDSTSTDFVQRVEDEELREIFEDTFDDIDDRDADVVKYRLGWDGDERTLRDIGEELGLSRERIRQIENSALEKVKVNAPDDLKLYLDKYDLEEPGDADNL